MKKQGNASEKHTADIRSQIEAYSRKSFPEPVELELVLTSGAVPMNYKWTDRSTHIGPKHLALAAVARYGEITLESVASSLKGYLTGIPSDTTFPFEGKDAHGEFRAAVHYTSVKSVKTVAEKPLIGSDILG